MPRSAKNLQRDPRVALSVDDQAPPFAFVTIRGRAELVAQPDDLLTWTTRIAQRYVGPDRALEVGRKSAEIDDLLVRIDVDSFTAYADVVT
jgi:nitroimidazol reductase NimA-like FMN-containing flavoprotein (pyridoxamine 5'-phosphate oxidase superfamily)